MILSDAFEFIELSKMNSLSFGSKWSIFLTNLFVLVKKLLSDVLPILNSHIVKSSYISVLTNVIYLPVFPLQSPVISIGVFAKFPYGLASLRQ